jgi:hypothetical protein
MHESLELAIRSHLEFHQDDFTRIAEEFRWGYWAGDGEGFYCQAVRNKNMSAVRALERYFGRSPFITATVQGAHSRRERLVCGSQFAWKGKMVRVTSFRDDEHKVVAVSYRKMPAPEKLEVLERMTGVLRGKPSPIEHIFRITNAELRAGCITNFRGFRKTECKET